MVTRWSLVLGLSLLVNTLAAHAADEKAPAVPAANQAPAEKAPAAEKPATPATPAAPAKETPTAKPVADKPTTDKPSTEQQPSAAETKFSELFAQRAELVNQLEQLQIDYKNALPENRQPIRKKFEDLRRNWLQTADQQTVAAAAQLVRETNGANEKAVDFLQSAAVRYSEQDRYEQALAAAQPILDTKVRNPRLYALAGVAAYHTDQFKLADKYFVEAGKAGTLDSEGTQLAASIDSVEEKWDVEQNLRAAEKKADDLPRVELVTAKGRIVLELFENEAPGTVANFVSLVEKGFYNGLSFHRVLSGFVAQGGDPKGDGTGGPGYHIPCECYRDNARAHFRGSLSMAHAGKDTGGSQFFLTLVRTPSLDGKHTVFGRVIEGMDVVSQLQRRNPQMHGKLPTPDKILEARVLRKRGHEYVPVKLP